MAVTRVIYTGTPPPTKAYVLGALLSAILYVLRGRRSMSDMVDVVFRAARTSCMLGTIMLGAQVFSIFFALTQTTQNLVSWRLPVAPWVTDELGMVMPLFGLNAFVISKYSGLPLADVFLGLWPHIFVHLIATLLLFPALTLWLPA